MMSSDFQQRELQTETTDQWLWVVIVATLGSFFAAFGIGANDAANAFATSVGAKALTIRQALVLAALFELLGAVLIGRHLVEELSQGLYHFGCMSTNPGVFIYGLMCIMYTIGALLTLASNFALPVSTASVAMGATVGMFICYDGDGCIIWFRATDTFPYLEGIGATVLAWVVSPFVAGAVAMGVFYAFRAVVLRSEHAFDLSFRVFPILVILAVGLNVFFFVYDGPTTVLDAPSLGAALLWSIGLGIGVALIMIPTVLPVMKTHVAGRFNDDGTRRIYTDPGSGLLQESAGGNSCVACAPPGSRMVHIDHDVHACVEASPTLREIHARAEKFDPRVEEAMKYAQVVIAICDSFVHGANSAGSASVPLTFIYLVYFNGGLLEAQGEELGASEYVIYIMAAFGLALGLVVYGYKVIGTLGVKLAKITPARGFCIEFGAAFVIAIGSKFNLVLSSAHCQVGATAGVAMLEGVEGLNYTTLRRILLGWAATFIASGLACSLIFAQGAYAPFAYDTIDLSIAEGTTP